jgi:hypothetical protein
LAALTLLPPRSAGLSAVTVAKPANEKESAYDKAV